MQNIVGNSKTKSSSWNTTTYSTLRQNTFTNRLNEVHGMHLLQNREVKYFVIKSIGDSEKILNFWKTVTFARENQRIFWENEKFVITALTRQFKKKLL